MLNSYQSNNITAFSFKRPINVCNAQKQTIDPRTPQIVIFAIGTSNAFMKHAPGMNGNTQIDFTGTFFGKIASDPKNESKLKLILPKVKLNATDTTYCYTGFSFPNMSKSHIIKEDIQLNSNLTHHMVLYRCDSPPSIPKGQVVCLDVKLSQKSTPFQDECQGKEWVVWARGGIPRTFPADVGKPIGKTKWGTSNFLLEVQFVSIFTIATPILLYFRIKSTRVLVWSWPLPKSFASTISEFFTLEPFNHFSTFLRESRTLPYHQNGNLRFNLQVPVNAPKPSPLQE